MKSISTSRASPQLEKSIKPKKVEEVPIILNRVIRAKCCLEPQNPEDLAVIQRAVGDGSEYVN